MEAWILRYPGRNRLADFSRFFRTKKANLQDLTVRWRGRTYYLVAVRGKLAGGETDGPFYLREFLLKDWQLKKFDMTKHNAQVVP